MPVLLVCYNRRDYLDKTLRSLYSVMPDIKTHPVIVAQDGADEGVARVVRSFPQIFAHIQRDHIDISPPLSKKDRKFAPYYHISANYYFALSYVFSLGFKRLIIVEEDMEFAEDFFDYFNATAPLLDADPSLLAVSAYNDNNKPLLTDPYADTSVFRSDFFAGLGWLMTSRLFFELQPKWPTAFWDDWLRDPAQRKGRHTVIPFHSRTHTFGKLGASKGQFYELNLKSNVLTHSYTAFGKMDLTSKLSKDAADRLFDEEMGRATPLADCQAIQRLPDDQHSRFADVEEPKANPKTDPEAYERERVHRDSLRDVYTCPSPKTEKMFGKLAKTFGVMEDLKAGVPRGGYRGHVRFYWKQRIVYLKSPNSDK